MFKLFFNQYKTETILIKLPSTVTMLNGKFFLIWLKKKKIVTKKGLIVKKTYKITGGHWLLNKVGQKIVV